MLAIRSIRTSPARRRPPMNELAVPAPQGRDILVEVRAVSVNPVDVKVRGRATPEPGVFGRYLVDAAALLGFGLAATLGRPGDAISMPCAIGRSCTKLRVDDIVGTKPKRLDWAGAAAMPLTAITAWEALFDRLDVRKPVSGAAQAIVIIGGAGGVGSIAIQLARALTGLRVIGTASRSETAAWVSDMGAHHVIDHAKPLAGQVAALGIGAPAFVFSTTQTDRHLGEIAEMIAPQGRFGLIDDPPTLDINPFKRKSVSVHFELMFTRSIYGTADIAEQGRLLNEVSRLVDDGAVRT